MGRVSDAKERLMEAVRELIWTGSYGRTTIDQICEKAGVKKGSFYYFFDSKADLAVAAIEEDWQCRRSELDSLFSATIAPLERLRNYREGGLSFEDAVWVRDAIKLPDDQPALNARADAAEERLRTRDGVNRRFDSEPERGSH